MSTVRSADERVEAIAELAYGLWEERGCPEGSAEVDWYKAEMVIDGEEDRQVDNEKSLAASSGQV